MRLISLTRGKFAKVDDDDFDRVSKSKWYSRPLGNNWYACKNIKLPSGKKTIQTMHRFILNVNDPIIDVDHKNGDGLDNRTHNLRACTHQQNCFNQKLRSTNTIGRRGVDILPPRSSGKIFRSRIMINGKTIHLGCFSKLETAAEVYEITAKYLFGDFFRAI